MTRIKVHSQLEEFLRTLSPEPRGRLTRALKLLPGGDVKALEGTLSGYFRLRVGGYRVIYSDTMENGIRTLHCIFAERRAVIYELFEQILAEQALE